MAADEKWYFTKEQLANTPSRKCGIDADKELSYRQQAANFIQDMGQRLVVTQLCINTAIVYMHRFYVFHSLSQFHRNSIASAALFLAAKVEEQPRKLEHVIKVAHMCLHRDNSALDVRSEAYQSEAHDLVFNENVLLQTLGFDVAIDHPHTHVVRCCHLVKASKDLAQTSYFMASNSLHLTTMCLQYKPTVVACFCIHLACKWSNWEIPQSNEGKSWFWYVDRSVTSELLAQLTAEFLHIFDKCPSRLKKKIMSISERQSPSMPHSSLPNSPFDVEPRRVQAVDDGGPSFQSARPYPIEEDKKKPSSSQASSSSTRPPTDYREYRDKKERERLEREKLTPNSTGNLSQESKHHHTHHHKQPSVSTPLLSTTSSSASSTMSMSMSGGPGTPVSSKHMAIAQKTTSVHHNNHHHHHNRPDLKLQQKHSNSTGPRDPSRDNSRQRIPRDYQQPPNYPQHQLNAAANNHVASKDSNAGPGDVAVDPNLAMPDLSQHPGDKASNNNHHSNRQMPYDKRGYDPRHKIMEHRKDEQKNSQYPNPTPPPKYPEHIRSNDRLSSSRKLPELEQRSEEVRKLIEKPLPIPKPRAEIQKEEYIANMMKPSHHPNKYSQDGKLVHNNSNRSLYPHDLSKQTVVKSQIQPQHHQHHHHHHQQLLHHHQQQQQQQQHSSHMSQMFKEKNGSLVTTSAPTPTTVTTTNPLNPSLSIITEDKLPDKRKHDELNTQVPLTKHKSLFSPDKITPPQDITLNQRNKFSSKQKTPPVSIKSIKQDLSQDVLPDLNTQSLFSMSPELSGQHLNVKREPERHHHHNPFQEIGQKAKSDDTLDKKPVRLPDLLNSAQANMRTDSLKLPELLKPVSFESELHSALFNNGLDIKSTIKLDNDLSPMKSAQGISALLQEPLAPMPSLLQSISTSDEGIYSQVSLDSSQNCQELSSVTSGATVLTTTASGMKPLMTNSLTQPNISELIMEPFVSTVDISAFSAVPIIPTSQVPTANVAQPSQLLPVTATDSSGSVPASKKQDNHHKSEKKKKKDKHKHKDKDKEKSKDKHKHKHKDKDKHRDKDKEKDKDAKERKDAGDKRDKHEDTSVATAPIRITIPKDKLNLMDTGSISESKKKSPQNAGIKIKIPKERLKNKESSSTSSAGQAPLKLKIRTNATAAANQDYNVESRKREREPEGLSQPPTKKFQPAQFSHQQQIHQQFMQRVLNEKQNGRHYNASSNNKEKHSSREHKSSSKLSQSQQMHPT